MDPTKKPKTIDLTSTLDQVKGGLRAELALDLPRGAYKAEWVNTKTGAVDKAEDFDHDGGARKLTSPAYEEDIALRVQRGAGL